VGGRESDGAASLTLAHSAFRFAGEPHPKLGTVDQVWTTVSGRVGTVSLADDPRTLAPRVGRKGTQPLDPEDNPLGAHPDMHAGKQPQSTIVFSGKGGQPERNWFVSGDGGHYGIIARDRGDDEDWAPHAGAAEPERSRPAPWGRKPGAER
jgi:hypothetical protein